MKEVCYVGAQRQLAGEAREDGRVYVWHVPCACEHGKMITSDLLYLLYALSWAGVRIQ